MPHSVPEPALRRPRHATAWFIWTLAGAILIACACQTLLLVLEFARYYSSTTVWLLIEGALPIYLVAAMGCVALLRRRMSGFIAIYVALAFSVILCATTHAPFPAMIVPQFLPERLGSWPSPLAFAAIVAVGHVACCRHFVRDLHGRLWQFGLRSLLVCVLFIALILNCAVGQPRIEATAKEIVEQALTAWLAQDNETALALYERVVYRYPYTGASIDALCMSGHLLGRKHRHEEAVARFHELLRIAPQDFRDSDGSYFSWRNEHHDACRELSSYYEEHGQLRLALTYAALALEKHPFRCDCGAALVGEEMGLRDRIERLESRLASSR